jgi:hypothetical protein
MTIEHKAQIKHVNKKQLTNNTLCLQTMFLLLKRFNSIVNSFLQHFYYLNMTVSYIQEKVHIC